MTDYNALGYGIPTRFANGAVMPPHLRPMLPAPLHPQMHNNHHNQLMRMHMPPQHSMNYPPHHLLHRAPYPLRNPVRQISPPPMTRPPPNPQPITVHTPSRPPSNPSSKETGTSPKQSMPLSPKSVETLEKHTQTESNSHKRSTLLQSLTAAIAAGSSWCSICCVDVGSVKCLPTHINGKKHKRKVQEELKLMKQNEGSKSETGFKELVQKRLMKDQLENAEQEMEQKSESLTTARKHIESLQSTVQILERDKQRLLGVIKENDGIQSTAELKQLIQNMALERKRLKTQLDAERKRNLKLQSAQCDSSDSDTIIIMENQNKEMIDNLKKERLSLIQRNKMLLQQYQDETKQNKILKRQIEDYKTSQKSRDRLVESNQCVLSRLKRTLSKLQKERERFRFAAIALKEIANKLPSARINCVEWAKCSTSDHMTTRSKSLETIRAKLAADIPYGQYIIENNPFNEDCQYRRRRLDDIHSFVSLNGIGNMNPMVVMHSDVHGLMEVLGIRIITECDHAPVLNEQKECYSKMDIPKGTFLGQYVGNELHKYEYHKIFNGTKEEMHHLSYMHGDTLQLPDGKVIDIYVDGIGAGDASPFLYINDGRVDIREEETEEDEKRMNVEFVMVLCNGWPLILLRTTKAIKKGSSLWINYGPRFGLVLDEKQLVQDQQNKTMRSVEQILNGIDLEENKPIEIFGDDENESLEPTSSNSAIGKIKKIKKECGNVMGRPHHKVNNLRSKRKRSRDRTGTPALKRRKFIADSDDSDLSE